MAGNSNSLKPEVIGVIQKRVVQDRGWQILFALALSLLVHFRQLMPFGLSELLFLLPTAWLILRKGTFNKESLVFLSAGLLLCGIFLMSFIFSANIGSGLRYAIILFYNILAFWLVLNLDRNKVLSALKLFIVISAAVAMISGLALLLFYAGNHVLRDLLYVRGLYARGQGFLDGPNYYSIAMLLSFFVAYTLWRRENWGKFFMLIILLGVLVSLSRGAVLALAIFFIVMFLRDFRSRNLLIKAAALALSLGIIFINITPSAEFLHFSNVLQTRTTDGGGGMQARADYARQSIRSLDEGNTWIGVGRIQDVNLQNRALVPHNTYITVLIDTGITGFVVFCSILLFVFIKTMKAYRFSGLPLAIFLSLIAIAITNDYHFIREWWLALSFAYLISIQETDQLKILLKPVRSMHEKVEV